MFPRQARLTKDADFTRIYRTSRRVRLPGMTLCLARNVLPFIRVAVVASRKVSPRATKRNLYKRRVWAGLRNTKALLPKSGYDIVILLHSGIANIPPREITESFVGMFNKIHHESNCNHK